MINGASKVLLSTLLFGAGISAAFANQSDACEVQRQRCADRCTLSTPNFDCKVSDDGSSLAIACACANGDEPLVNAPNSVANTDSNGNAENTSDLSYCDTERLNCISLCANSTAMNADGTLAKVESFPVFYCEVDTDAQGTATTQASSCSCDTDINMNQVDASETPSVEAAVDPFVSPCDQRQFECEQACGDGFVPDFQCEADGDPNDGSFSIASACSCASQSSSDDAAKGGRAAGETVVRIGKTADEDNAETVTNGSYESGYRAGAKFVTGYLLSSIALMEAIADGEN